MMNKIIKEEKPTYIMVAFDKGKKTKRHQTYADYKGGRKSTPEEFLMQIPYIKEYLDILNIKRLETDDYEVIEKCNDKRYKDGRFYCIVDDSFNSVLEKVEFGNFIYGKDGKFSLNIYEIKITNIGD